VDNTVCLRIDDADPIPDYNRIERDGLDTLHSI
jgi:hypothetical protein